MRFQFRGRVGETELMEGKGEVCAAVEGGVGAEGESGVRKCNGNRLWVVQGRERDGRRRERSNGEGGGVKREKLQGGERREKKVIGKGF